jgi:glycosyltransferase involved in cell wall biosynthesis
VTDTAGPAAVAVVIPVWDGYVRWLAEAVDSVVAQGVAHQVIVVDNASLEPIPELLGATVVRSAQRLTTGAARNVGLAQVRTPFVVFLDADDLMLAGSLEALVAGIHVDSRVVAYCLALLDGDTGRRHRSPRRPARALARHRRLFAVANSVWSLMPTQGATVMRTADVTAAGGYADRAQGEDWVLGASLVWHGMVSFGDQPALLYRWRGD